MGSAHGPTVAAVRPGALALQGSGHLQASPSQIEAGELLGEAPSPYSAFAMTLGGTFPASLVTAEGRLQRSTRSRSRDTRGRWCRGGRALRALVEHGDRARRGPAARR